MSFWREEGGGGGERGEGEERGGRGEGEGREGKGGGEGRGEEGREGRREGERGGEEEGEGRGWREEERRKEEKKEWGVEKNTLRHHLVAHTHQLPVESSPGIGILLAQQSAIVLSLCADTDGLHHL